MGFFLLLVYIRPLFAIINICCVVSSLILFQLLAFINFFSHCSCIWLQHPFSHHHPNMSCRCGTWGPTRSGRCKRLWVTPTWCAASTSPGTGWSVAQQMPLSRCVVGRGIGSIDRIFFALISMMVLWCFVSAGAIEGFSNVFLITFIFVCCLLIFVDCKVLVMVNMAWNGSKWFFRSRVAVFGPYI